MATQNKNSLSSWNETAARESIIDFVNRVTREGSSNDRDIAYTAGAEKLIDIAKDRNSTSASVKEDWRTVFGESVNRCAAT